MYDVEAFVWIGVVVLIVVVVWRSSVCVVVLEDVFVFGWKVCGGG